MVQQVGERFSFRVSTSMWLTFWPILRCSCGHGDIGNSRWFWRQWSTCCGHVLVNGVSGRGLCWFIVRDNNETLWWSTTSTSVAFVKTRRRVQLGFRRRGIGEREFTCESSACLPFGTSAPVLSGEPISCWTVVNLKKNYLRIILRQNQNITSSHLVSA